MITRLIKKLEELEQLVLAHLRDDPETAGIRSVWAYLHEPDSAGSNWNIFRFEAETSNKEKCQAAVRDIARRLRSEFNAKTLEDPDTEHETRPIETRDAPTPA